MGAFIYRSENGTGRFATTGTRLRWDFQNQNVDPTDPIGIRFFAIEMVYVAEGSFFLGSGGNESGHFREVGDGGPYLATDEWNGCIENNSDCLWGASTSGNNTIGETGSLDDDYPTGFNAFYMMKYSITQQQYVDFLNTLTYYQQNERIDESPDDAEGKFTNGSDRHSIKIQTSGIDNTTPAKYETDNPFVANNFMSWADGAAYLDWAGLRPMT